MDLLKEETGTTILESLVVILLLGILVTLTASFFSIIFNNKNMLKGDALLLAQQEIERTLSEKSDHDTTYFSEYGNMEVKRLIRKEENKYLVDVIVSKARNDSALVQLNAIYTK